MSLNVAKLATLKDKHNAATSVPVVKKSRVRKVVDKVKEVVVPN